MTASFFEKQKNVGVQVVSVAVLARLLTLLGVYGPGLEVTALDLLGMNKLCSSREAAVPFWFAEPVIKQSTSKY